MANRFVAVVVAALWIASARAAGATSADPSPAPTPVNLPTLPPSAQVNPYVKSAIDILTGVVERQILNSANSANGQVTYFKRFDMQVQTGPNSYRAIHLHQGTVINPRGATIGLGQRVSVGGVAQTDGSLEATVITLLQ